MLFLVRYKLSYHTRTQIKNDICILFKHVSLDHILKEMAQYVLFDFRFQSLDYRN